MIRETERPAVSGALMFFLLLAAIAATIVAFVYRVRGVPPSEVGLPIVVMLVALAVEICLMVGLFGVQPNQGVVLQLFGAYKGTVKEPGLRWANPLYAKKPVSLRVRNFETGHLKVNEGRCVQQQGTPSRDFEHGG